MSKAGHPPRLARRLIRWALPLDRRDDITGDLDEVFRRRARGRGLARARLWYWWEALMFSARFLTERFREGSLRPSGSDGPAGSEGRARLGVAKLGRFSFGISWLDLKLGVRMLFKHPGLTLVGTFSMSIAIAIVAGFHAATEGVMNRELPVPEGDRIVGVWNVDVRTGRRAEQTLGDMVMWRESLESIEDVGAFTTRSRVVFSTDGQTRSVQAAQISPSAFRMLRVPPLLGRPLLADDERPGGPAVALLGFDLWQSGFGADTAIVGKTIRLGGVEHSVVGVMPRGFGFPLNEQLWTPIRVPGSNLEPGGGPRVVFSIGRLASGITLEEAETELRAVGLRLSADHPETHAQLRPRIETYASSVLNREDPGARSEMRLTRVLIAIVLIIAAVSVGTLVYARSAAREGEIAVRNALGASRYRIALQMFAEALVLASLAATVGVGIAVWALGEFNATMSSPYFGIGVPYWWEARMGPTTILVVVGLTLVAAVLTGVLPALKVTGRRMRSGLQRAGVGGSGLRFGKAASVVVVTQVAISMALLIVVGALQRQYTQGPALDDGIAREEYLAAQLRMDREPSTSDPNGGRVAELARNAETWRELVRRVSREPGVLGATLGTSLPGEDHPPRTIQAEGISPPFEGADGHRARVAWVEPNYFDVFSMPVRVGRAFDAGDMAESEVRVAIVNDAFVQRVLASGEPIGQRIRLDPRRYPSSAQWVEIVGVVRDVVVDLTTPVGVVPALYFPLLTDRGGTRLAVHVPEGPSQFAGRLRAIAGGVDPALMLLRLGTLEGLVGVSLLHLVGLAVGLLVLAAVLLSTAGVYALMSFTVTQRTREIGIRTALGANPRRIVGEIFSRALAQLAVGTFVGLGLGIFGTQGWVFTQGPGPAVGIAALILIMGLIACGRPVSRALHIQPTEALREGG